jgi:glycosyltransferase involved in cell wall biosynthesis
MSDLANLHICLIAGTLGQGGAEQQLFYIARALRDSGASVQLLSLTRGEYWEERIRQLGVPVTWVGEHGGKAVRARRIIKMLRDNPPDVVQSQHFYTNLYAVVAARVLGCREVGAMRSDCLSEVQASGAVLGRLSLRVPRTIAANSQAAIRNAIKLGVPSGRLQLLNNVVDTDRYRPTNGRRKIGGPVHLIAVGRLDRPKRFDRFLAIMARLRKLTATRIKATIIGEGSLRTVLERQAAELGLLDGLVEFRGAVSDMPAVYQEADILVLTSDYEGTPNVALEAMASGLALVATRVGGVQEVVRHEQTGCLVDADGDGEPLVSQVLRLIHDEQSRIEMGRRARAYVSANHSPERLPSALRSVYEVALS